MRRRAGWIVLLFGAVALGLLALQIAARAAPPRVGSTVPDFVLESTEGETISLAAQKGKPVVLVFVASWCEVCRAEMPTMVETYRAHQPHEVAFLGVDVYEDRVTARRFRDEFQIPFPLLPDPDGAVTTLFRVNGTPTTFFIDRAGILRDVVVGGPLDRAYLDKEIAPLLGIAK
jgi:peroxiredoxin